MKHGSYSFAQWCNDNNQQWLLDYWDVDANQCTPDEVAYRSNKKFTFWCGNPKHHKQEHSLYNITATHTNVSKDTFCIGCKSVAEFLLKEHDEKFVNHIWSGKNKKDPYEVSAGSAQLIWLRCLSNETHPDYSLFAYNVKNSYNCPYCVGKKLCDTNTFGSIYPDQIRLWSDKNELTPFDYSPMSNREVFLKCPTGEHEDYSRKICAHVMYGFRCPQCSMQEFFVGENNPRWNPNRDQDLRDRDSDEYMAWRRSVFKRDHYTCQCCLRTNVPINAHHIYAFAFYKDVRTNINNGITLCDDCHASRIDGSLHNLYGTYNVSPQQLEEYINRKRKTLGITETFDVNDYVHSLDIKIA